MAEEEEKQLTINMKVPAKAVKQFATDIAGKDGCGCGCMLGCVVNVSI
jgi:hypothetical protein